MIVKRDFPYPLTGGNRPLHIYLPDDYDNSDARYPVMYFFDGHNLFFNEDATYGKSWGMKEFLDGWHKSVIMVGIECGHGEGERLSEYLPYPTTPNTFCDGIVPRGGETYRWIIEEIKPLIDREYRTYPQRECTAIGGSSMGGLMALYGVVHHNDVFSKGACISSSISVCMPVLRDELKNLPIDPDTKVYLSWGTKEARGVLDVWSEDRHSFTYHRNRETYEFLSLRGAQPFLRCHIGGGHCEADWEQLVPEFMSRLWLE